MRSNMLMSLALAICCCACSDSGAPTRAPLDSSVNGHTLDYAQNSQFTLELDVHADGGYQWDCQLSDPSILSLDSTRFRPKQEVQPGIPRPVGGLTVETFCFRTLHVGQCTVSLTEHRAWETGVPPIGTVQFIVTVHR